MIKESFKVEELCAIIKECAKSGVLVFEFQGLKLTMGELPPEPVVQTIEQIAQIKELQIQADTQTRAANAETEFHKKQEQLDQMLIDDPEGYFEAVKRGDLTDEERT